MPDKMLMSTAYCTSSTTTLVHKLTNYYNRMSKLKIGMDLTFECAHFARDINTFCVYLVAYNVLEIWNKNLYFLVS